MTTRSDDKTPFEVWQLRLLSPGAGSSESVGLEPLGSKPKFWTLLHGYTQPWLFKYARPETGEHWAEKLGSELAKTIGLPAARVELADADGQAGVLVESIVPHHWVEDMKQPIRVGSLIHGNEILAGYISSYDKKKLWGQREHSYANIMEALANAVPDQIEEVLTALSGILVLDALIGNSDRHHENWALLRTSDLAKPTIGLAPSYDHASSLGRELADAKRTRILREGRIADYVRAGRGAIFGQSKGKHADNPLELVRWASAMHPDYFHPWIERVHALGDDDMVSVLNRMPRDVFSTAAAEFCRAFLGFTLKELQGITV